MHAQRPGQLLTARGAITDDWLVAVRELREVTQHSRLRDAVSLACRQGLVVRRAQARDCGLDEADLRQLVRRRIWSVPRRGVLCPLPPIPQMVDARPYELTRMPHGLADQVRAAAAAIVRPGAIVSHESGAAIYGLPLLHAIERPTLVVVDDDHRVETDSVSIRCGGMHPEEIADWFGAPVLTAERVVADLARSSGVPAGLVAADAALRLGLTTSDLLDRTRAWSRYRPGIRHFHRVLELVDGGAESPLESLTRLCLVEGKLSPPELQVWIDTARGRYRVDMLYRRERVIVEADGELKYDGRNPLALVEEKRRQEALERAGYRVVRVSWYELRTQPWNVVARVRRALATAH